MSGLARVTLVLLSVWMFGCSAERPVRGADVVSKRPIALPPGEALPEQILALLEGSDAMCDKDEDCPGSVCTFSRCLGLMQADVRWVQETGAEVLVKRIADHPELRRRVIRWLVAQMGQTDLYLGRRARGVVVLERLGARDALAGLLKASEERLQQAAALALTRIGDSRGVSLTRALTEDAQVPLQVEAVDALGLGRQPGALEAVLRALSVDLDRNVVRTAIRALKRLGDPRAIRALIAFWEDVPPYLEYALVDALRTLTKAKIGSNKAAWVVWVEKNNPPPSPKVTRQKRSSEEELGIPEP